MADNAVEKLAWQYLERLYELSEGGLHPEVDQWKVYSDLGFSLEEMRIAVDYLTSKDLVSSDCRVPCIRITTRGIDEMARIMAESYSQRKRRVLEAIADMSKVSHLVAYQDLAKRLGMGYGELGPVCSGLEEQGFILIFPGGDIIQMKAAGHHALEPQEPHGGQHIHIHHPQNSPMQFGSHNAQSVAYNNEPISKILPQLAGLIEAVRAEDFADKDEVLRDLEIAHKVALANPNATVKDSAWSRILTKLNAAKATMEMAGLVVSSYPYWPQVLDFFSRHIQ